MQRRKRNTVLRVGVALLPPPQAALARGSICPCHATEYWTGRSGQLATPRKSQVPTPLQISARDMRCSKSPASVHMTYADQCPQRLSPRLGDFKARRFPKTEPHRPETRTIFCSAACARLNVCSQHACLPRQCPSLPAGQHYPENHACRNTKCCRHSSGWLGLTQGKIVHSLMGTNCS